MEAGYSKEDVEAVLGDPATSPRFTDREKAALQFAEEVTRDVSASIATFARMRQHFTPEEIIELSAVIGMWCMWNRMVEVVKPDVEDDVHETIEEAGIEMPAAMRR